jgi:hydroxymethylpyrimidine pyrophosphatase-like HAD family hydrolase
MRYFVLASDFDETLAIDSQVDAPTLDALGRLVRSARRAVLVTGRLLDDLLEHMPDAHLFARIVAENGAVLYDPESRTRKRLAEPPPGAFVAELRARGVAPLSIGDVIVATREPHEATVLAAIRDMGMGHQVIFNKGAVMVLPPGVDKGTGLGAALDELGLSAHNVVGVGDAENDHAFLQICELAAAVNNALPLVQQRADLVTRGYASHGVGELIDELVDDDLARFEGKLTRHHILLGNRKQQGEPVMIPPYASTVLLVGPSGSGKSQTATALLERVVERGYQACLVDPEGDYQEFGKAVSVGDFDKAPSIDEVIRLLGKPSSQVVANLLAIPIGDRPSFFSNLLPRLQTLRSRTGRPHWIMVDEAHHILPASWAPAALTLPHSLGSLLAVTVHPEKIAPAVLQAMGWVLAVGPGADETMTTFARAAGVPVPALEGDELEPGEALVWICRSGEAPFRVEVSPATAVHRRHRRKYAQGELAPENSFYFRGPDHALHLRAHNLTSFLELSSGVDPRTWLYHLRRGDYSRWFREQIKDDDLARRAEEIERQPESSTDTARAALHAAIKERYTLEDPSRR